jgi:outer membrane protein assembly factor BamB
VKLTLALVLLSSAAHAQNWPSFRGPNASGVAHGHATATTWDATKGTGVLWKTELPGLAVSSPIVWGDSVFVTTAVSSDPNAVFRHGLYGDVEPSKDVSPHSWRLLAIDKRTGKVRWERVAHEGVPKTKRHPKSSQASCTPATNGKVVVAWFGSEGLYAYDLAGKLLWQQDLGRVDAGWFFDPDYEWGAASSPVIYRDLVIVQVDKQKDSFMAAYRLKDGKEAWRTAREEIPSWGTPTVYQGPPRDELVTQATKFIRGYDPATGKELWRLGPNSEITTPTPIVAHGMVYVTNGYGGIQPIYAIKPGGSATSRCRARRPRPPTSPGARSAAALHADAGRVRGPAVRGDEPGRALRVRRAAPASASYQERVAGKGGAFSASPVAADGKLYLTGEDGEVFVVKAGRKPEWLAHEPDGRGADGDPRDLGRRPLRARHGAPLRHRADDSLLALRDRDSQRRSLPALRARCVVRVPSWETEARTLARVRRLEAVNVVKMNQPRVSLVEAVAIVDRWLHEDGAPAPARKRARHVRKRSAGGLAALPWRGLAPGRALRRESRRGARTYRDAAVEPCAPLHCDSRPVRLLSIANTSGSDAAYVRAT